jgi:hypothetical protein
MSFSEPKKAAFAIRLVTLLAATLLFVFSALVVLENKELHKLLPPTPMRAMAILLGYCAAISSANYAFALKGRNLTTWRLELLIVLNYAMFFAACVLPSLFPNTTEPPWWWPLGKSTSEPNAIFYGVLLLQLPLLIYTATAIRRFFRPATPAS